MNDFVYIGKIVNTFGIKGELKIISDFEYKDRVLKKDFKIYIGKDKNEEIVFKRRTHKNNELVLLYNYNDINDVLKYKNQNVYVKRNDLELNKDEYLIIDLIGMDVYDNMKFIGKVIDYEYNSKYGLFKISDNNNNFYIPNIDTYIDRIDIINKKIYTKGGSDLIL